MIFPFPDCYGAAAFQQRARGPAGQALPSVKLGDFQEFVKFGGIYIILLLKSALSATLSPTLYKRNWFFGLWDVNSPKA